MAKATILTEDFAGMKSQAFGFAERAGYQKQLCSLTPKGPWSFISAPYWPFPLKSVKPFHIEPSEIIISVGSVGGVINAALRNSERPAIHIQNPRISPNKFDLVIVNPHDRLEGKNILISRTALHHISPQLLAESKDKWAPFFKNYKKPLVSVLIGGNNGRFTLGLNEARQIANQLAALIITENVTIALTPSRRTDPQAIDVFKAILTPLGAFIWDGIGENPYLGLLACADLILVTMDSVSMVSEAVATSVPVMIISLPGKSKRISLFIQSMQQQKRVKLFYGRFEIWNTGPLDDTEVIVYKAKKILGL
ncbi:mitochondrial fission ELM1 family protein [Commensalibacter papalotli (ex Botero et al. 2024)]|uniref:Mitochondrial fission protein ELM1 (ELM1) n=1 Tax=Commensalibacter papalotli (ex Botero et al. 2024) TaxID=2972766 RepID=A0ABM9HHT8_9PROT|nr:mitochondrial fission ELM1 family protein [Commensalibacter papalotli (ex Botero et al. 2024)]CAI3922951.1 Mitochondrial fission protein ELM1 (ELM1) [Commensalibacter papalotli (ex Botero et al. 2024)]CAI3929212.1 Mitochondrial fission protein ELM1 (ELM1) [Commensalibacter papalotli (ex Botero et al. 2024)]